MKNIKSIIVVIVSLFLVTGFVFPINASTDPPRDPFYSAGVELDDGPAVNVPFERVDPFSGNLSIVQTDIKLPGNGGLDLEIMRFYDSSIWSRRDVSLPAITAWNEKSPVGIGWSMHMGIVRNPFGKGSGIVTNYKSDNPVLELPDGSRKIFYRDKNDISRFITSDHWVYKLDPSGSASTWKIISPTGMIYTAHYGANAGYVTNDSVQVAQIVQIENPSQTSAISINYNKNQYYSGQPILYSFIDSITDSTGRIVYFTYDYSKHQLKTISVEGLTYNYTYDSVIGGGVYRYNFLKVAQSNVGDPWRYAYDMSTGFQLTSMTYPTGGRYQYTYVDTFFPTGKVNVKFRVVSNRTAYNRGNLLLGTWTYAYNPGSASGAVTTITAPDGITEKHTFFN